jgi:hypothetical protein
MSKTDMGEKKEEVVLDVQDMDVIERFFTHFEIKIPGELSDAIANFRKCQDVRAQNAVKLALTQATRDNRDSMIAIDEIFEPVVAACEETAYNLEFERDLEDVISGEKEPSQLGAASSELEQEPQAVESSSQVSDPRET